MNSILCEKCKDVLMTKFVQRTTSRGEPVAVRSMQDKVVYEASCHRCKITHRITIEVLT